MKKETAQKRTFNYMRKHYPLLRNGLIMYFVEIILLTYKDFTLDEGYNDMTNTEKLNYAIEINTNDEYHNIINDYNNNVSDSEKTQYSKDYVNTMIKFNLGVK